MKTILRVLVLLSGALAVFAPPAGAIAIVGPDGVTICDPPGSFCFGPPITVLVPITVAPPVTVAPPITAFVPLALDPPTEPVLVGLVLEPLDPAPTAAPEPATLLLWGTSVGGLALARWYRRRLG